MTQKDVDNVKEAYKARLMETCPNTPYAILHRADDGVEYCVKLSSLSPANIRALTPESLARIAVY